MKKLTLLLIASVSAFYCHAQVSLDQTFANSNWTTILSSAGEKIYSYDSNGVYMYNMDYTIFKTIHPNTYPGYRFFTAQAVSDNLFNSDNLIEYVAIYLDPITYIYKSEIVNENGVVLKSLGNSYNTTVHYNSVSNNYKLFAFNLSPATTDIYSLPGSQPCGQCGALGAEKITRGNSVIQVSDPLPNPSNGVVRINYTLPVDITAGTILFYNAAGEVVKQMPVLAQMPYIDVNNSTFKPGVYLYNLKADNITSVTKTMVIK